jgi:hypothetical protein
VLISLESLKFNRKVVADGIRKANKKIANPRPIPMRMPNFSPVNKNIIIKRPNKKVHINTIIILSNCNIIFGMMKNLKLLKIKEKVWFSLVAKSFPGLIIFS